MEKKIYTDEEFESLEDAPSGGFISDDEFNSLPDVEEKSLLTKVGEKIDSVTGAPTRAAVMAGLEGRNPIKAGFEQFGEVAGPEISGRAIVDKFPEGASGALLRGLGGPMAGPLSMLLPDETKKDIVGIGADVALDYTNLIPGKVISEAVKLPVTGAKKGIDLGAKLFDVAPGVIDKGVRAISPALADISGGVGKSIKSGIDSVLNVVRAPTLADDAVEAIKTAKKYNIDPKVLGDSLIFGPEATITKMGKVLAQGPEGDVYRKQFETAVDAVSKATDEFLAKLSSKPDAQSPEAIGNLIKKAKTENVAKTLSKFDVTNKFIIENVPGWKLNKDELAMINSKLVGTDRLMRTMVDLKSETNVASRNALNDAVKIFSNISKNPSYKSVYEKLDDLGEYLSTDEFKNLENSKAKDQLKSLYKTVRDSMTQSVKRIRPDLGEELVKSNKGISEYLNSVDAVTGAVKKTDAGEDIFRKLVRGASSDEVRAMKNLLTPDQLGQVKQGLVGQFVRVEPGMGEEVLYKTDINKFMRWAESNKSVVENLFTGEELQSFRDLEKLRRRVGDVKFNTSNTDVSSAFRNFLDSIKKNAVVAGIYEAQKVRGMGGLPENVAKEIGFNPRVKMPPKGKLPGGAMGLDETRSLLEQFKGLKSKTGSKALQSMSAGEKSSEYSEQQVKKDFQENYK